MTIKILTTTNYPYYDTKIVEAYDEEGTEKAEAIARDLRNKMENGEIEDFQIEILKEEGTMTQVVTARRKVKEVMKDAWDRFGDVIYSPVRLSTGDGGYFEEEPYEEYKNFEELANTTIIGDGAGYNGENVKGILYIYIPD